MISELSKNEKLVLWGLVAFPALNDQQLAAGLGLRYSTFCTVRKKLKDNDYYSTIKVPVLQRLGAEMFAVIYTMFNPAISVNERADLTRKTIEVFDELVYSVGETHKGFSLNMARNYSDICRINDIRIDTFAKAGILDQKHPTDVLFPFGMSHIPRFMDHAPLLASKMGLELPDGLFMGIPDAHGKIDLTKNEKIVMHGLVSNPEMNDKDLASHLKISRHIVSKSRKMLEAENLIIKKRIPNLLKLGFKVMTLSHIKFNPRKPLDDDLLKTGILHNPSTVLLAARKYECIAISAFLDYEDYRDDYTHMVQYLKENDYLAEMPETSKYMIPSIVTMKEITFGPIVKKILEIE
ncbi:MAG: helix-turn-helix domain-containing protein [Thermoplasmata archaeon]